jgi:hypothetical protein
MFDLLAKWGIPFSKEKVNTDLAQSEVAHIQFGVLDMRMRPKDCQSEDGLRATLEPFFGELK